MDKVTNSKRTRKQTLADLEDFPHNGIHHHCARLAAFLKSRDFAEYEAIGLIREKFAFRPQRRQLKQGEVEAAAAAIYGGKARPRVRRLQKLRYKPVHRSGQWPVDMPMPSMQPDPYGIRKALKSARPWSLEEMWEASPIRVDELSSARIVGMLFNPDDLVVCGTQKSFAVRTATQWGASGGIVGDQVGPNPNAKKFGRTKKGNRSCRCRDATGKRRHLVVESDDENLDFVQKATLLRYLGEKTEAKLRMVVHSAGKSLHGWFEASPDEPVNWEFMQLACRVGADPRMWLPEQLARLPNAVRKNNGLIQKCFFFDPS